MRSWTVHATPSRSAVPVTKPAETRLVPEGFCWAAFLFGPLWLIGRGHWLAALAAVLLVAAVVLSWPAFAAPAVIALHLMLGLTGHDVQRARLARRGMPAIGVVLASDRDGAILRLSSLRPDLARGLAP